MRPEVFHHLSPKERAVLGGTYTLCEQMLRSRSGAPTIIRQTELSFTLLNDRAENWRTVPLKIFRRLYWRGARPYVCRWKTTVRIQSKEKC